MCVFVPQYFGTTRSYPGCQHMPDSNCICFKCKRSLIEIVESSGLVLTGCVNCNIWWKASGGPVREYVSQETLRVLTQALTGTAVSS